MNLMDEKLAAKLRQEFGRFGVAKIQWFNFSKPSQPEYARVELTVDVVLLDDLVREFNTQLTTQNGINAFSRWFGLSEQGKKMQCVLEIVPYDDVRDSGGRAGMESATLEYLGKLPHVLRNYANKRGRKKKK
jgi:hypothetical protein